MELNSACLLFDKHIPYSVEYYTVHAVHRIQSQTCTHIYSVHVWYNTCTFNPYISGMGTAHATKPRVATALQEHLIPGTEDIIQPHGPNPGTKVGSAQCSYCSWEPEGPAGHIGFCQGPVGVTYGAKVIVEYLHTTLCGGGSP